MVNYYFLLLLLIIVFTNLYIKYKNTSREYFFNNKKKRKQKKKKKEKGRVQEIDQLKQELQFLESQESKYETIISKKNLAKKKSNNQTYIQNSVSNIIGKHMDWKYL